MCTLSFFFNNASIAYFILKSGLVALTGIEPISSDPESDVLAIVLKGKLYCRYGGIRTLYFTGVTVQLQTRVGTRTDFYCMFPRWDSNPQWQSHLILSQAPIPIRVRGNINLLYIIFVFFHYTYKKNSLVMILFHFVFLYLFLLKYYCLHLCNV